MLEHALVRFGQPCQFDQFPYGTICKVINSNDEQFEIFLQISENEEVPKWELLARFDHHHDQDDIENLIYARLKKNIK